MRRAGMSPHFSVEIDCRPAHSGNLCSALARQEQHPHERSERVTRANRPQGLYLIVIENALAWLLASINLLGRMRSHGDQLRTPYMPRSIAQLKNRDA